MFKSFKNNLGVMVIAITAIILNSCKDNSEKYFSDSLKVVNPANVERTDILQGIPVVNELIGAGLFNVVDTLICFDAEQDGKLFTICTLDGDSVAVIGIRGQGPNDFISTVLNKQNFYNGKNDFGTWVVDANSSCLKQLNIGKSLSSGSCVVDSIIPIQPMVSDAFVVGDTILQVTFGEGNYDLTMTSSDGTLLDKEPLYQIPVDKSDIFYFYSARTGVSPDNRYLVMAMSSINQLNILDLQKSNARKSVSIGGVQNRESVMDSERPDWHTPAWTYYSNLALSDKYIFALYRNMAYNYPGDQEKKNGELHVFDYDGNPVCIIPLDRFIYVISYSPENNSIYALGEEDKVWRYDLSSANI